LPDAPFSRLHRRSHDDWPVGNRIQLQQRNCSGFTPDFSRRSTDQNSQRTVRSNSGLRWRAQDLFKEAPSRVLMASPEANLNLVVTGGAGFIGSNLVLELQDRFPN